MAQVAVAVAAFSAAAAPGSAFLAPPALPSTAASSSSSSSHRFAASRAAAAAAAGGQRSSAPAPLRMVAQPPVKPQKLDKINILKQNSEALREPVRSQMQTEEISISHDAYQILKFHGSYMQDDRSLRKKGQEKVGRGAGSYVVRDLGRGGEMSTALFQVFAVFGFCDLNPPPPPSSLPPTNVCYSVITFRVNMHVYSYVCRRSPSRNQ